MIPIRLDNNIVDLLEDSILVTINYSNRSEIVFDIISKVNDEWCRYYLYIREASNFYYQRFTNSFQRTGFVNLARLNFDDKKSEWIKELIPWYNPFTKENGLEFKLYGGEILRFVGSHLALEQAFVEGPIESIERYSDGKPDHIKVSTAKVIINESFVKQKAKEIELEPTRELDTDDISLSEQSILEPVTENDVVSQFKSDYEASTTDFESTPIAPQLTEALDRIDKLKDNILDETVPTSESQFSDEPMLDPQEVSNSELIFEVGGLEEDEEISDTELLMEDDQIEEVQEIDTQVLTNQTSDKLIVESTDSNIDSDVSRDGKSLIDQITNYADPITEKSYDNQIQSIEMVNGVTSANKASLEKLGYDTIEKLSKAKIAKLTEIKGIGKATARKIIQSASELTMKDE